MLWQKSEMWRLFCFFLPFIYAAVHTEDKAVINRVWHTTLSITTFHCLYCDHNYFWVFSKSSTKKSNTVFDMRRHAYLCTCKAASEPRNSIIIRLLFQTILFLVFSKSIFISIRHRLPCLGSESQRKVRGAPLLANRR